MTTLPTVGFIGLGSMGWPMAANLHKAGYPLRVLDSDDERMRAFVETVGGQASTSARELASQCDIILTILPTSDIVRTVLTRSEGVLAGIRPGSIVVDMTSGVPTVTQALAEQVAEAGADMADAPVSGGVPRAKVGELSIMFGGTADALARVEPVLRVMGNAIELTGPVGSAHAMKALNNMVSAGGFLIAAEALMVGKRFGLDPQTMISVLNASTGMNNATQKKFREFVLNGQYNSGFGLDLMIKDLGIAMGLAHETTTAAPFSGLCREMWVSAAATLGEGQDHTAIAKLVEKLNQDSLSEG